MGTICCKLQLFQFVVLISWIHNPIYTHPQTAQAGREETLVRIREVLCSIPGQKPMVFIGVSEYHTPSWKCWTLLRSGFHCIRHDPSFAAFLPILIWSNITSAVDIDLRLPSVHMCKHRLKRNTYSLSFILLHVSASLGPSSGEYFFSSGSTAQLRPWPSLWNFPFHFSYLN
jgi:hypothetical protein